MRRRWWLAFAGTLSCVTTVVPQAPAPPPPPPPVVVPEGCLELQAGPWVHETDPTYRYAAEDDGGTLTLTVDRVVAPDAGFVPRRFRDAGVADAGSGDAGAGPAVDGGAGADAGATREEEDGGVSPSGVIELTRGPGGFTGEVVTTARHPTGRVCELRFPTKVLGCTDGGLTLETEVTAAIGDACQPPARPQGLSREVHRLVRPKAP